MIYYNRNLDFLFPHWRLEKQAKPRMYDYYINSESKVVYAISDETEVRDIVVRNIDWPEWLEADWVAKDADGEIWAYIGDHPIMKEDHWDILEEPDFISPIPNKNTCTSLSKFCTPFTIEGDWRYSLVENPLRGYKTREITEVEARNAYLCINSVSLNKLSDLSPGNILMKWAYQELTKRINAEDSMNLKTEGLVDV